MPKRPSEKNTLRQEREKLHVMLLSSVSHDLKTPLACVIGSLEIYQQLKDTLSTEHKDTLINTAIEEARRLDSFVTNIIDMSRLESGIRFKREYVDVGQLVRQCVLKMESRLRRHEVLLEVPFPVMAGVGASWISRAVIQLLDNAARYTSAGTRISVAVSKDASSCRIVVRDNGKGLSKKIKAGLFNKHARTARKDATTGTGLGLPICRAVMEAHGGSIRADTPAGGGTVFTLTLPATFRAARKQKRGPVERADTLNPLPLKGEG